MIYACDDENVKTIGIWLEPESITYEKSTEEPTGELRYQVSSVLHDEDQDPGHSARFKVSVLGMNARGPGDVKPAEIPGTVDFCAKDPEGRLRVSVENAGPGDAVASTTRLRFEGRETFDLSTPPLPAGDVTILELVAIPKSCAGDCSFSITADANDVVLENDEGNNTANGLCIG